MAAQTATATYASPSPTAITLAATSRGFQIYGLGAERFLNVDVSNDGTNFSSLPFIDGRKVGASNSYHEFIIPSGWRLRIALVGKAATGDSVTIAVE